MGEGERESERRKGRFYLLVKKLVMGKEGGKEGWREGGREILFVSEKKIVKREGEMEF